MAEHKHQQQDLRAGLQHLANLKQDLVPHLGDSVLQHHQAALAEAALEAHLQRQQQAALVAIRDLERLRLNQQ